MITDLLQVVHKLSKPMGTFLFFRQQMHIENICSVMALFLGTENPGKRKASGSLLL